MAGTIGCGGSSTQSDVAAATPVTLARSGERLSVLAYQAGDAVQFRDFHDDLYGFDCEFALDVERTLRCFPKRTAELVYLDAGCQVPAARTEDLKAGDWIVGANPAVCPGELGSRGTPYVVGEQIYGASIAGSEDYVVYEVTDAGQCQPASARAKTNAEVRSLVARSSHDLVTGRIDSIETSRGLRVERLVAEDGTEANIGVRLSDGTACTLQRDGRVGAPSLDGGRTCREPATLAAPSGATLVQIGSAPLHLEMFELRAESAVFQLPAGVRGEFLTSGGESCAVGEAVDGSLRCVDFDDEVTEAGAFSDRTCETRLYQAYHLPGAEPAPLEPSTVARLRFVQRDFDQDKHYQIIAVSSLKPHIGAVFAFDNQRCVPLPTVEPLLALDERLGIDSLPLVRSTRLD